MTLTHALLLGVLQGATEFLPVSSSGHLAITQHLLTGFSQPGILFDVLLHVGTMLAVILYFRRELAALAASPFRGEAARTERRVLLLLVLGSLPTALIGLTFKDFFEGLFHNIPLVGLMLLVTGTLLFVAERLRRQQGRTEEQLTIGDALLVGAVQGLAIIPGISRSGSTIAALLLKGVDGETAARFSFLLALPAIFGAAILSLGDLEGVPAGKLPLYLAGTGVAFLTGLASIHLLLGVIRRRRLAAFAVYCWCAGGLAFWLTM